MLYTNNNKQSDYVVLNYNETGFKNVYKESIIDISEFVDELVNHKYNLYMVASPAGFGKTTVMYNTAVELVNSYSQKVIWYNANENDNSEQLFIKTLNDLVRDEKISDSKVKDSIYFFIDNFQIIANSNAPKVIENLIKSLGDKIIFIIITNDVIDNVSLKMMAYGEALLWNKEKFRIRLNNIKKGIELTDTDKNVLAYTGGWALPFFYALNKGYSDGKLLLKDFVFIQNMQDNILLYNTDKDIHDVLCRYSLVERIINNEQDISRLDFIKKCDVLEGLDLFQSDSDNNFKRWINALNKASKLQLLPSYSDYNAKNVSGGYSQLLYDYMSCMYSSKEKEKICLSIGKYFEDSGNYSGALKCYVASGNVKKIIKCLEKHGNLFIENDINILSEAVKLLDNQQCVYSEAKVLGIMAQYYYYVGDNFKVEQYLNKADSIYGKENIYSTYRGIYKSLVLIESSDEDDKKNAVSILKEKLFYIKEYNEKLPFLKEKDKVLLNKIINLSEQNDKKNILTVNCFGEFNVIMPDNTVMMWRTKKSCELFAYLIHKNGIPLERKEILSALWREIPLNAVAMLHNMIYNIRKELAVYNLDNIIQYKNKKYSIDIKRLSTDLDKINYAYQIVNKKELNKKDLKIDWIDSISGSYMENIDTVWADERRNEYDKILVNAYIKIGNELEKRDNFIEAEKYYKRAIKLEPYSEDIMKRLLNCYKNRGDWNSLKKQLEKFVELLKSDLGIVPRQDIMDFLTLSSSKANHI